VARQVAIVHAAPVDPALVEERLLAYQKEQAAKGSPSAQLALARRYSNGQGVEANPAVARVWLEAAARSGSEEAKADLESK
jgi:TPR repeat protein